MSRVGPGGTSLRAQLLAGLLLPVGALLVFNSVSLYRQALAAADTAYDRTLLASAKSIGELLSVTPATAPGDAAPVRLVASVPYSALEAFEADNRSRMVFRVTGFAGEHVAGFDDLPAWRGTLPQRSPYAALVDFYDDRHRGESVRVAVLLQPVAGAAGQGMATIQVAETLELRRSLARELLLDTLWRQGALLLLVATVVVFVVQRATRPVRELGARLAERERDDLSPLPTAGAPRELRPVLEATNAVIARLAALIEQRKRFVRDASHQLRTPLAVLKTQLQSARRGDVAPAQALDEMRVTVERATELANQMLALAKVEQLRQQPPPAALDWAPLLREVALEMSALIVQARLDFEIDTVPAPVRAHEWMLRELPRNLLHNAVRHGGAGRLRVSLRAASGHAELRVRDDGPGLAAELGDRLFQPFATAAPAAPGASNGGGSGLGLAICREIAVSLGGSIRLERRPAHAAGSGDPGGLDAVVMLPLEAR